MIGCYLGHGEPALLSGGEAMDEDDPEPGLLPAHSFLPVGQVPAVFEPDSRRGDQRSSWYAQPSSATADTKASLERATISTRRSACTAHMRRSEFYSNGGEDVN